MPNISRSPFLTVKTEGGLLPPDLLQRVADGRGLEGLRPEDYHLLPSERLNEAINRSWSRCIGAWAAFDQARAGLAEEDTGTTLTRDRWLLVLFDELGFGRLQATRGSLPVPDGDTYPISHLWADTLPLHLVTFRQELDKQSTVATRVKRTPHSLMQEFLNRAPAYQWGIISNGLQLRILHDNASLRRAAFVEFDLEAMLRGELYADFTLLWLVCHVSRFERRTVVEAPAAKEKAPAKKSAPADDDEEDGGEAAESERVVTTCWLDEWQKQAAEQGTRVLAQLRDGVSSAITLFGSGFLKHPHNKALREALQAGDLSTLAYYQELRRLVYRLIFLLVAEDRDLLFVPGTDPTARRRYEAHYSLRQLRQRAEILRGGPHPDLYRQLRQVFVLLRDGYPALGLPGLGSFLFSERSTPDLDNADLANEDLLDALRALCFTQQNSVRRAVDFRNLDSEELGSVYEDLLELHPRLQVEAGLFELTTGAGSERKTTGSHYTPTTLVECLLDSALDPVVADRLQAADAAWRKDNRGITQREAREQALLSIKVLDYAAGSGHMLIGAGRRLANHLARIRSGEEEPTPSAFRHAMRDVVRHCLYAVDLNDMAVELCKVALWMESMEPGKPLSFLDAHIQWGNSLIGVTPGLDISVIPDEAFTARTGDDKTTAAGLKRRNRTERSGQMALGLPSEAPAQHIKAIQRGRAQLEAQAEETPAAVRAKEEAYTALRKKRGYKVAKQEANLWTAAFFWPLRAGEMQHAPTQGVLEALRAENPDAAFTEHQDLLKQVNRIARANRFFHWAVEFPEVFARAEQGFDVVLSNPPWERIKLQEKEWFAQRAPEVAAAPNASARKAMIEELLKSDPSLHADYREALRGAESESAFIRNSGKYPLCGRGDVNTYTIFAELARQVVAPAGRAGVIVPTGIATDDTTKYYFQDVMETGTLASLYDFENRRAIFPGVHRSYKFALLTLRGKGPTPPQPAEFVFFALDVADLREPERRFSLTAAEIALLNPNTRTCPIFRNKRDAELTKRVYARGHIWIKHEPPENSWQTSFCRMVDPFSSRWKLIAHSLKDRSTQDLVQLYEGKMVDIFDHRSANVVMTDNIARPAQPEPITNSAKTNPLLFSRPRYWVPHANLLPVLKENDWNRDWLLVQKKITSATNERTHIACIIPLSATAESAHTIFVSPLLKAEQIAGLYGNLVAIAFDFTARQKLGSATFNYFVLEQLPVLPPEIYDDSCAWGNKLLPLRDWLLPRVLELTYTAWDLEPFAQDCGYDGPPFRWDEERRFLLRAELDAAYFHLYGIARDDVAYIMETFPIVKRKDIAKHGEYRTQRVILEIYDAMAQALATGIPYATRLDPPPADARVAHPARGAQNEECKPWHA